MPAAPDLETAAAESFDNLFALFSFTVANLLKSQLTLFAANLLPQFPQQQNNSHPVSNWLVLIAVLADQIPSGLTQQATYDQLVTAADYVYRCCWMTNQLAEQSLISAAQSAAVLAEYNADF